MNTIGIRREDKSRWEARVPLTPADLKGLHTEHGIPFKVEQSPIRAFGEDLYSASGAEVTGDLSDCPVIIGVKEIPPEKFLPNKTYVFFSHTIKGQEANMPALKRLMELNCQLMDYERIVDENDRRLVFFGPFAGLAGMIDTLWTLGQRLVHEGIETPLTQCKPAHQYKSLADAKDHIAEIGKAAVKQGLPDVLSPLVCGFAGYGQVSQGAQEVFDILPIEQIAPEDLASIPQANDRFYKVVFEERHLVERTDSSAPFNLQEYYDKPELYRSAFEPYVPHLTMLVNCIYWEPKYPKLLTREYMAKLYQDSTPRLRVVGDITCDIDGSVECTTRSTTPDSPIYVYDPTTGETKDGVEGNGPVVLAVDFLPCELPVDASTSFSKALRPFVPAISKADFSVPMADSGLPMELQRAMIVYQGKLTPDYEYLREFI